MSPWNPEQMQQKNRKLSPKEAKQAAAIANNVYESEEGGQKESQEDESKRAGNAIRIANSVVKKGRMSNKTRPTEREKPGTRRMMKG